MAKAMDFELSVRDVAAGDVLNIRAEPDANALKVGAIPPGGHCIRNLGCASPERLIRAVGDVIADEPIAPDLWQSRSHEQDPTAIARRRLRAVHSGRRDQRQRGDRRGRR